MRRSLFIPLIGILLAASSCQRKACVTYDPKTGHLKTTDQAKKTERGLFPENPKKVF